MQNVAFSDAKECFLMDIKQASNEDRAILGQKLEEKQDTVTHPQYQGLSTSNGQLWGSL